MNRKNGKDVSIEFLGKSGNKIVADSKLATA